MHTVDVQHIRTKNAFRLASNAMNQPPDIGSRVGFAGLGDARQPGVAMPGKGSELNLKMAGEEVGINDETLLEVFIL